MTQTKQFLIIDDHPLYLDALEAAIRQGFDDVAVELAGSVEDAEEFLETGARVDVVLLDLRMPGKSGFDGLMQIKGAYPRIPVVVISSLKEPDVIEHARSLGASGFIIKSTPRQDIIKALDAVLANSTWFPGEHETSVGAGSDDAANEEHELTARIRDLTPQQFRVLQLICDGMLNKQIAYELNVGQTTVKAHISSILKKLNVHSRTQAVLIVQRIKLHEVRLEHEAQEL